MSIAIFRRRHRLRAKMPLPVQLILKPEKRTMRKTRNNQGFTLIELMIVVVIIGILAAIAIPRFTQVSNQAKQAEAGPILKQMCSLAEAEFLKTNAWPADLAAIQGWDDPQAQHFNTWAFDNTTGTASAAAIDANLQDASMDCETKVITLS
jgi:prepilin-type N-terminal cleavage/methylation domain-containing protein